MNRKKKLTLTLGEDSIKRLAQEAARLGVSKSAVVAMAIDKLFAENPSQVTK